MPKKERRSGKLEALRQRGTLNPHPEDVRQVLFQENEFFDARDLVQVKYEMLRRVQVEKDSVSQSALTFGFSRPSFYQAQSALEQGGLAGLIPQKRGPRSAHKLNAEIMTFLTEARIERPAVRSGELALMVRERFGVQVHPRTIERRLSQQEKKRR